ncbi:hypothetical protein CIB84_009680 [Bambusicola thoracicus]|uniref:Uncharacterized protein n=1 Tax=Bambusicola thoracicus TaxID=9083 RepID=A0A2P4SR48_BAMTH|nr:hypothetical protein CIB84_009680 [Bambusicola thoracicus]
MVLLLGTCPSGWMPCSRHYSSQQALPICMPAWPTWMEMHSHMAAACSSLVVRLLPMSARTLKL